MQGTELDAAILSNCEIVDFVVESDVQSENSLDRDHTLPTPIYQHHEDRFQLGPYQGPPVGGKVPRFFLGGGH